MSISSSTPGPASASARRRSRQREDADLVLEPPVKDYGLLDFGKLDELIEIGYRHTMEHAAAWLKDR